MEKISIIIPVYNAEKYLERCINSLVNQTYKNIEIVIINDGSKDRSKEILLNFKKRFPKIIKIINQENCGIGAARNMGLKKATGKYIGFVDSDDYVELDMYEKLYNKIAKTNADIVICDYYEFNSQLKKHVKVGEKIKFPVSLENYPKIINEIDYAPWNKLYKKELFTDIFFPIKTKYEDLNTILKVFSKAKKIEKIDFALYDYLINENGETQTVDLRNFDSIIILKDIINYFNDFKNNNQIWVEIEKLTVHKLYYTLIQTINLKNRKKSIDFMKNTINLLNTNFPGWKKRNLNKYSRIKKTLMTNKFLYSVWILIRRVK